MRVCLEVGGCFFSNLLQEFEEGGGGGSLRFKILHVKLLYQGCIVCLSMCK